MKINIAGAGAGKTTQMGKNIIAECTRVGEERNIYCITFTNNATTRIEETLRKYYGKIPSNIKVSTIHSFLYKEIIQPYYYLLYGVQYNGISYAKLSSNPSFRNKKIRELEKDGILHVEVFTERAKWVLCRKTKDTKEQKEARLTIRNIFSIYCAKIFIDEAQDIDKNLVDILKQLSSTGIKLELMGDPKQDLKGFKSLRKLVEDYPDDIKYINICYRCPQNHLRLSNCYISGVEQQYSENTFGNLVFIFENDIDVSLYIEQKKFDLLYISEKNDRYETSGKFGQSNFFNALCYELEKTIIEQLEIREELIVKKTAYYFAFKLVNKYRECKEPKEAMKEVKRLTNNSKEAYARIIEALKVIGVYNNEEVYLSSIEGIKGQEGKNCLFVLTTDLAAYLFKEKKEDNKTKNKLYVALTRSLEELTILITSEVEKKYGKDNIIKMLSPFAKNMVI